MGDVAEWLRSGLQIRGHRFESGRRLHVHLKKKAQLISMSDLLNEEYVLNLINKIDYPGNIDLIRKIEYINVSGQTVKIIINSELSNNLEKLTDLWQSQVEKDSRIKN